LRVKIEMSFKRASVNPLAGFLKPQSPAERLALQHRDREKLQKGKAAQGAARGRGKGKGRGWEEACGATFAPLCGYCCM
jgi:hypothetical protein